MQRKLLRRATDHERVVSGHKIPAVLLLIEDGEVLWRHLDAHLLTLAGRQFDLAPADQALGRFARACRKRNINLCDFRAFATTGVLHRKGHSGGTTGYD